MKISEEERKQGKLTEENLAIAWRSLREGGYIMIESVLSKDWVETMREAFEEELKKAVAGKENLVKKAKGHYGTSAPMRMPFLDPIAIENSIALQIMEAAMGKNIFSYLPYGCNTSWPGSGVQHIHRDTGQLFPEVPYVLPVSIVVVNIPLADFTIENGSTEVWPGTHLIADLDPSDRTPEKLEARAAQMPSVRMVMPAGSLVVRDLRVWHRGMPNTTQTIRTMLALVYFRQFHHLPDNLRAFSPIPRTTWEQLSERARQLYRYDPVLD